MSNFVKILSVSLVAAGLACGGPSPIAPLTHEPLESSRWELRSLMGDARLVARVTLDVEAERMAGYAGCNWYGGLHGATDGELRLRDLVATERACITPQGVLKQEQRFFTALGASVRYGLREGQLVFLDASNIEVLRFVRLTDEPVGDY